MLSPEWKSGHRRGNRSERHKRQSQSRENNIILLSLPDEPSKIVVACHCFDCQRRTGAPFGVGACYPADVVTISGTSKEFTHAAASGGKIHNYFCPQCGSTVYWRLSNLPALIGRHLSDLLIPTANVGYEG